MQKMEYKMAKQTAKKLGLHMPASAHMAVLWWFLFWPRSKCSR